MALALRLCPARAVRFVAVAASICAFSLTLPSDSGQQKTKGQAPPKPPAAKPSPPKADPLKDIFDRAKATLQKTEAEFSKLKPEYQSLADPEGRKGPTPGAVENYLTSRIPFDPQRLPALDLDYKNAREGKLDAESFYQNSYSRIQDAMRGIFSFSRGIAQAGAMRAQANYGASVNAVILELDRARNQIRTNYDAEIARLGARASESVKAITDETAPAVRAIGDRFANARKRWCAEWWRWVNFAARRSAKAGDVHHRNSMLMAGLVAGYFFEPGPNVVPIPWIPILGSNPFESAQNSFGQSYFKPYAWVDGYPDRVKELAQPVFSYGPVLQPPVAELKEYVEVDAAPRGIDARIVFENPPGTGLRAIPRRVEGSDAYTLFLLGDRLPRNRAALREIKAASKGILYRPLAYQDEYDKRTLSPGLKALWDAGFAQYGIGPGPEASQLQQLPGLLIEARLTPGVLPGFKKFALNGADTGWFLDQGTSRARITFCRDTSESPGTSTPLGNLIEETGYVFRGERLFVQIESASPIDASEFAPPRRADEIELVFGRRGVLVLFDGSATVVAKALPGSRTKFRSPIVELVEPGDPRLDPENKSSGRVEGLLYLSCDLGEPLQVGPADPRMFSLASPVTTLEVSPSEFESLWVGALKRAARVQGLFADVQNWATLATREVDRISNTAITQVLFKLEIVSPVGRLVNKLLAKIYDVPPLATGNVSVSNRVTLGNQAAMLLMRDRFIEMIEPVADLLTSLKTEAQVLGHMESTAPFMPDLNYAVGNVPVEFYSRDVPGLFREGFTKLFLREVYDQAKLDQTIAVMAAGEDRRIQLSGAQKGMIRSALLKRGFESYRRSVVEALDRAQKLEDKDIQGLLELTGFGFGEVVKDLVPRLVKLQPGPTGSFRFGPDRPARSEVQNLFTTYEAVKAQREYSELDTAFIVAAASLLPFALGTGVLRSALALGLDLVDFADIAFNQLPKLAAEQKEYEFSIGAYPVLGNERFNMADQQRSSGWQILLNLTLAGIGVKPDVKDFMGAMSKGKSLRLASETISLVQRDGYQGFARAGSERQAALAHAAAAIEIKKAKRGDAALTPFEQDLIATWKVVDEQSRSSRAATKFLPEPQANVVGAARLAELDPMPANFPAAGTPWRGSDDVARDLGEQLGQGTFFKTFVLKGTDFVLKALYVVEGYARGFSWQGVRHALEIIRKEQLPALRVRELFDNLDGIDLRQPGYYIQARLVKNLTPGQEYAFVKDLCINGQLRIKGAREAVIDFMYSMYKKGIAWEDMKWDNMYVRNNNGKWEAGITDPDSMGYWGELPAQMNGLVRYIEAGVENFKQRKDGLFSGLRSVTGKSRGTRGVHDRALNLEGFWRTMFERKGWLAHDGKAFVDGILNADEVFARFKELDRNGIIDLSALPVARPALPPGAPPIPKFKMPRGEQVPPEFGDIIPPATSVLGAYFERLVAARRAEAAEIELRR